MKGRLIILTTVFNDGLCPFSGCHSVTCLHLITEVEFSQTSRSARVTSAMKPRCMTGCIFLSLSGKPLVKFHSQWKAWSKFQEFKINILKESLNKMLDFPTLKTAPGKQHQLDAKIPEERIFFFLGFFKKSILKVHFDKFNIK